MSSDVINIDPEILGGTPVFKGTRVPIECFFVHLEKGMSIDEFLEEFPTVTRKQIIQLLEIAEKATTSKDLKMLVE